MHVHVTVYDRFSESYFYSLQDYFNFVGTSSRLYLPPIPSKYDFDGSSSTKSGKFKITQDIPKTFTTRKGALLLFSEDLAAKGGQGEIKHRRHRKPHPTELSLEVSKSADELELKTVDDLAKSILSFGGKVGFFKLHVNVFVLEFIGILTLLTFFCKL